MTDPIIAQYMTAGAALISAFATVATLFIALVAKKKVEEVRHSTNSMREQLEAAAFARGVLQEQKREKGTTR